MQQDLIGAEVIGYMALTSQYNVSITSNEETFVFSIKENYVWLWGQEKIVAFYAGLFTPRDAKKHADENTDYLAELLRA